MQSFQRKDSINTTSKLIDEDNIVEKRPPKNFTKIAIKAILTLVINLWGYSAAGSALGWQPRGQGFDPPYLHQ